MALELQQVQSRLIKAKKETYRLEKTLAKTTAHNKAEAQSGGRRSAPLSPSPDSILGDWVAEERPRADGGERTWALSRKLSNGGSGSKKEASTLARSASAPVGGRSAAAATSKGPGARPGKHVQLAYLVLRSSFFTGFLCVVVFEGRPAGDGWDFAGCHVVIVSLVPGPLLSALYENAAAKRGRAEKEEELVSLGSDDDDDDDADDHDDNEDKDERLRGGKRIPKNNTAQTWVGERPLETSTLLTPVASSRSFFTSAAAVAGGRAGAQQNGKRAK